MISVITINYNNASGLRRTLDSVFSQDYKSIESIVIDGGSTDLSKSTIIAFEDKIRYWISETDTGPYQAMNRGIEQAKGDYLLFLNSGDVFSSQNALSEFVGHGQFSGDVIYGDYLFVQGGKKNYPDQLSPYYFMRTSLPHQSTLFSKRVFELMGPYDESYKLSGDRSFYLASFLDGRFEFRHVPVPLSVFDLRGMSNDPATRELKLMEDDRLFRDHYGVYYEDMKLLAQKELELSAARRNSVNGYLKRLLRRLKP